MAFDAAAMTGIQAEAQRLGVEWEALAAVAETESGGRPLWDGLCPIRIEGHYFDKRLTGDKLTRARQQGLADPKVGGVKNPGAMADRYAMLQKMSAIDAEAAIESCSWGLGQVMGTHWKKLGYASASALAEEAKGSVTGQVRLMGKFIEVFGLLPAVKSRSWATFAKSYNGAGFAKNQYDTKMAAAYGRFKGGASGQQSSSASGVGAILERGSKGEAVKALQARLAALNYYRGKIDGDFGVGTEAAVKEFQSDAGIQIDGRVGPNTLARLKS